MAETVTYPEQMQKNETLDPEAAFLFACESLQRISALNGTTAPAVKDSLVARAELEVERSAIAASEALVKDSKALNGKILSRAVVLSGTPKERSELSVLRQQNTKAVAFGARTGQPLVVKGKDGVWKGGIIMQPPHLALGSDKTLQLRFRVGTKFGHDPEHVDYSIKNAAVERANGTLEDGNTFAATPKTVIDRLGATLGCAFNTATREPATRIKPLTELASFLATLPSLEISFRDCGITPSVADRICRLLAETFLSRFVTPDQLQTIPRALIALDAGSIQKVKVALLNQIWPHDLPFSTMMLRTTFAGEGFTRFTHVVAAQRPALSADQITVETMSELAQLLKGRLNNTL